MTEKSFSDIDANYKSKTIGDTQLNFQDGFSAPFVLEGFPYIDGEGRRSRLPLDVAKQCEKEGVYPMSMQGAGEIIRFRTDSKVIGLHAEFDEVYVGHNRRCSAGFDLYSGRGAEAKFHGNQFVAPQDNSLEALFSHLPEDGMQEYTLHFPVHSTTSSIEIGVLPGSRIEAPLPHKIEKPIVFYGSSITNGGAAGRPGLVYPVIIARRMDFHLINMGLSGSCRGELCIADTIAKLDIAALVIEFDHNAPDPEFLAERHEPFFKRYRQQQPDVPVLMMSRCDFWYSEDSKKRRNVIMNTYCNAINSGDKKVDYLDGETLFSGPWREECTSDNCHPNDLGAALMAERIGERLGHWI